MDYFESGYSVREPMWHGKGKVKDRYPKNWAEAREWADLEWEPELAPAFGFLGHREDGSVTYDPADAVDGMYLPDEGSNRIVRNDTHKTLAVRTDSYKIISHETMGEIMEAILEQPNVKYETAGATHGGKRVWALVRLDEPVVIPGDNSITLPLCAVTNRHDGTGSCRAQTTGIKIVCANTFSAAEAEADTNGVAFSFPHTGDPMDRIEEARETIRGIRRDFRLYCDVAEELLKVKVTHEQSEQFVNAFIPEPPVGLTSERVKNNVATARDTLRTILMSPTSEGIENTAWGHVQAAGEYLDHYRRYRSLDSAYTRSLLAPEPLKNRAVKIIREIAPV